ncbi:hypothetical protein ACTJI2_07225 [Pseudoxanthomonas sp. 22568]|uniref:hypothetical protein n=1 Tax=Pseudoxanthomonas sp. 22568 TaxID=3453945 RepID=UPI00296FF81C|nr:hypothetical protein LAG73_06760 [Pseudoxanthomonas japonensis]
MSRVRLRLLLAAGLLASAGTAAAAPATVDAVARERMTEYLVDMFPIHRIFAQLMEKDPKALEAELDGKQRACFSQQVARPAFVARKRRAVDAYADQAPDEFQAALKLLDEGAGDTMKELGGFSIDNALAGEGQGFDPSSMPPDRLVSFMTFAYGSQYRRLRELSGYGEFTDQDEDQPSASDAQLAAMATEISDACGIPPKFFE